MLDDLVVRAIRTYVPIAVGAVVTFLAVKYDIVVPEETSLKVIIALEAVSAALYHAIVQKLERRWPALGWLLGAPKELTLR